MQTLKTQAQADPGQAKRQALSAKLRATQEREERIRAALAQLPEVAVAKKRNGGKAEDARASTTDADARVMKMGDGGFRSAFNVQFATPCKEQLIVGMEVVNTGSDMAQLAPMVEQPGAVAGRWRLPRSRADRRGGWQDPGLCAGARAKNQEGREQGLAGCRTQRAVHGCG